MGSGGSDSVVGQVLTCRELWLGIAECPNSRFLEYKILGLQCANVDVEKFRAFAMLICYLRWVG